MSAKHIAYFSAEYGIDDSLKMYCGGLGILAGDYLKEASDFGLPLIGVGLMYREGYFVQSFDEKGWQQESYRTKNFTKLPVELQLDKSGKPLLVSVTLPKGEVRAQIWKFNVGKIPLYLLDTDLEENSVTHRRITHHLYGGDHDMRIQQEILLGVGGIRALNKLGIKPSLFHMNEGHSAFLGLERIRDRIANGLSFEDAQKEVTATNVFTTHTPVAAGNDWFPPDRLIHFLKPLLNKLGLPEKDFLTLGREEPENPDAHFCMTILAMRLSRYTNGVSRLHGQTSRKMWKHLWPDKNEEEVPINSITNGVHYLTWMATCMQKLFDQYLAPDWRKTQANPKTWEGVASIPNEEIRKCRDQVKKQLIDFCQRETGRTMKKNCLTIGFARRFATYKRATMLFDDRDRIKKILTNTEKPVQILFAGKAHPRDENGKKLLQKLLRIIREENLEDKVLFLENYDMGIARFLVQGVDLWLNNPKRPYEASGTSGMKVIPNGGLNLSILDGWWVEAYQKGVGWAIPNREDIADDQERDKAESQLLYDLLEDEIIPLYYEREGKGWLEVMKKSMTTLTAPFSMSRMIQEYFEKAYGISCEV